MKYFILVFLFSISFLYSFDGKLDKADIEYIKNKKEIKVCINPDWAPIEFRDKIPKGISIDILKYITAKLGLKLKFIYTPSWSISQQYLKEGKCDITPTAIKTSKREKYAIFTRPYLTYDLAIITTQDKPYITNINAISNKVITRKKGSGIITKLKAKYPTINIIETNSYKDMFKLVSENKAYATIATLPVFAYYQKKYNFNNLKIAGFSNWKYPLRIMVNKNEKKLRDLLDIQLKYITPQITQNIYEKWIVKTKSQTDYKKLLRIITIFIVLLAIFALWIYILYQKNMELKKLSNIKNRFLENMSHELRTPLNSILGFLQLLKQNPKDCKKHLPIMYASSEVLLSMIDNLLNFSLLENKTLKIKNTHFDTDDLKSVVLFYEDKIKEKGLELKIDSNMPQYLYGDFDKIRDILVFLLDNAIKFTQEGIIAVSFKYEEGYLIIKIKDTGIGISSKKLKKVFEPFIQLDDRTIKEYKGIGMGLNIAKKLAEILKGKIDVESEPQKGSEFTLKVPVSESKDSKFSSKYDKILVVEDNEANLMFMEVLLRKLKVDFDIAKNGAQAVDMYKEFQYPLILMDINMPVMDGMTAAKKIIEFEKENDINHSVIIAVTAQAVEGDEEKFLKIMDGYISKPIDIQKLKEILK